MGQPSLSAGTAAAVLQLQTSAGPWRCEAITPGTVERPQVCLKGVLMEAAGSIHISRENIYPLWDKGSNNGPVAFKERQSETVSTEIFST